MAASALLTQSIRLIPFGQLGRCEVAMGTKRHDDFDYVVLADVSEGGDSNVNDSNVQNENVSRRQVRHRDYTGWYQERTLLSQPPSIRRASLSLACTLRQLVALASFNSRMMRICKLSASASAWALIRNCSLTLFGACFAVNSSRSNWRHISMAGSPTEMRYDLSIFWFSSINFLCIS